MLRELEGLSSRFRFGPAAGQGGTRSRSPARSSRDPAGARRASSGKGRASYASNLDHDAEIELDPIDPAWQLSGAPHPALCLPLCVHVIANCKGISMLLHLYVPAP